MVRVLHLLLNVAGKQINAILMLASRNRKSDFRSCEGKRVSELYDTFHNHFEVVSADTTGLMETAYRLRYQVYCREHPYEDADAFPDQMETDEYDMHSSQSLVRCRASGQHAGLVRLVLPDPVNPDKPLPIETFCDPNDENMGIDLSAIPRESLAEISRFCVSKESRHVCAEKAASAAVNGCADDLHVDSYKRLLPHITLGLFAGIVRMSAQNNVTHWLAVMEPTLLRFLTRFGIHFRTIGPLVDHHGKRQPVIGVIDEVLAGIHAQRKDVWETITNRGYVWPLGDDIGHAVAN
jgi:N-acyl amino acid synthase of PEP-CTERM/exosortase system